MLFTFNERIISSCNHQTSWSQSKYLFLCLCFHAVEVIRLEPTLRCQIIFPTLLELFSPFSNFPTCSISKFYTLLVYLALLFHEICLEFPPYSFIWPYSFNWYLRLLRYYSNVKWPWLYSLFDDSFQYDFYIQPAPSMTFLVYNDPSKMVYNDPSRMVYNDPF